MSREILFKAKRVDNGEWVEGQLVADGEKHCWIVYDFDFYETKQITAKALVSDRYAEVQPETVCEYTGKYDKNGNKIFFGDKLKIATPTIKDGEREDVAIVKWNERYSKIDLKVYHKGKYKRTTNFSNLFFYGGGEIIGTKFDMEVKSESKRV